PDLLERFVRLLRARHGLGPFVTPIAGPVEAEPAEPTPIRLDDVDGEIPDASTLIHVRCFGGFSVFGSLGELVPTVDELTNDAAWDRLAALAASPEGTLATSELIERVWPGASRPAADDALRGALGSLHQMLLRVAPGVVGDVVRFASGDTCHLDTRL